MIIVNISVPKNVPDMYAIPRQNLIPANDTFSMDFQRLVHLVDVLENAPNEHDLADLGELEREALPLQVDVGLLGLLVHQGQLRVLRTLEEIEVPHVVLRVVDHPCEINRKQN
jgi:hypothetical protein